MESESKSKPSSYAQAGVDIHKAESFLTRLKVSARRDGHRRLWRGSGGYASVYPIQGDSAVALSTDGVGTKLLLAIEQDRYDTIGIDLVAMCVNDLLCVGATPSVFLDYYAMGALDERVSDLLMEGIIEGCDRASMLLVGGETAEMPDLYDKGHFDLAGFAVGTVKRDSLITGDELKGGERIIGVSSTGIHSNGLSLARKLIKEDSPLRAEMLTPTAIYTKPVVRIFSEYPGIIKGLAHITGGGWTNITRPKEALGYVIDKHLPVPEIFKHLGTTIEIEEMYKTFNMGVGLCVMADAKEVEHIISIFKACDFEAMEIGEVTADGPALIIRNAPGAEGEIFIHTKAT